MGLSDSEKRRVIEMLDSLGDSERRATLASENSFLAWLKRAASWLWERLSSGLIATVLDWLWRIFVG